MPVSSDVEAQPRVARDHGFHPLSVREVVRETADTCSLVLDVPDDLRDAFAYQAGQFVTFRLSIGGRSHLRSYSMSSSPDVDEDLCVTVKRVPGGVVSNWINDIVRAGDALETTCPAGVFCLGPDERDIVAFAGGSGITPVVSILKSAMATTSRRARLLYANRDRPAVIFADVLDNLGRRHPDRLEVVHHLDVDNGFVTDTTIAHHAEATPDPDYYICGPGPFMTLIESSLLARGVDPARIHIERFTPREEQPEQAGPHAAPASAATATATPTATQVTIELDGRTETTQHRPGTTLLQTARQAGLSPPFSCEAGDCATCMAKLVEGTATMQANNALMDDEVDDGWVLTCQAVPDTPSVHVVYGYD